MKKDLHCADCGIRLDGRMVKKQVRDGIICRTCYRIRAEKALGTYEQKDSP